MTRSRILDYARARSAAARHASRWRLATAVALVLAASSALAAAGEPKSAEYAIRWNARDGGPATINDALGILKSRATRVRQFRNEYYDLPPAKSTPPGFSAILRRHVEEGAKAELAWKLRGDRALAEWTCPLPDARQSKAEVDVTFVGADATSRTISYSCTSEATDAAVSALSARILGCPTTVFRRDAGKLKLEEWHLPGDVVVIEVSMTTENSPATMEIFRTGIVTPLLAAGVVPLKESKTDLGSRCP